MAERDEQPERGRRRRLKSWQGWLLLAFAALLVPVLFVVYIDGDDPADSDSLRARTPAAAGPAADGPNPISDALRQLPPPERTAALEAALHDSGAGCGRVRRTFFQGHGPNGAAYWNVVCGNGQALSLQFPVEQPDVIRVVECALLEETGLACFKRFGEWV